MSQPDRMCNDVVGGVGFTERRYKNLQIEIIE